LLCLGEYALARTEVLELNISKTCEDGGSVAIRDTNGILRMEWLRDRWRKVTLRQD